MPELPEVETTRRGIEPYIVNQTIQQIIIREHQLRWKIPSKLVKELPGKKITKVIRRGKYLLFFIDQGTLILHLGMSGSLLLFADNRSHKKHDHVDILFVNNITLRFTDPRKFGAVLFTTEDPLNHPLLAKLGPEPLTQAFSPKHLATLAKNRTICIKSFIMDSKVVVGIGNIYATEALFLARINPNAITKSISAARLSELVYVIKKILRAAIKQGGTTLKDFVDSEGKPGYFAQKLKVYGRAGQACLSCDTTLLAVRISNRNTVYCPKCQLS